MSKKLFQLYISHGINIWNTKITLKIKHSKTKIYAVNKWANELTGQFSREVIQRVIFE